MDRVLFNIKIAFEALFHNKVRSFLTALGIIFGVASVVAMQSIGRGARQEILDQIKLVGVNNIVILQKKDDKENKQQNQTNEPTKKGTLGLSMADALSIKSVLPQVKHISPEAAYPVFTIYKAKGYSAVLTGVEPDFFKIHNLVLEDGRNFNEQQVLMGAPVCIIGYEVKKKFFPNEDAVGKKIKCKKLWLEVIGVLENRNVNDADKSSLGISNYNLDIYAPIKTVLMRHQNRALITKASFQSGNENDDEELQGKKTKSERYNELDKLVVQVDEAENLQATSQYISQMLLRRHNGVEDFEIIIPELLLKQQQRTKDIFNLVLGTIAAISLLVGGIGIMNIMLVSVMERMKEIGIRMALGATRKDIILQFLSEAIFISMSGGIVGILLGLTMATLVKQFSGILTIVTPTSVVVAFLVSAGVGLISGLAPARKASRQDPVESLRYE